MIIKTITVENFGAFRRLDVDFKDKASGIGFINGNNGRGKTTILDALKWCLYGEGEARLSRNVIKSTKVGQLAQLRVAVSFELEDGTVALVERAQNFQITENLSSRAETNPVLEVKTKSRINLFEAGSEVNPEAWLENKLPKRLMNFVLFDGEQMAKFFDLKTKSAIEKAVLEIAGVETMRAIYNTYSQIKDSLEKKIAKASGKEAEDIQTALEGKRKLALICQDDLTKNRNRQTEVAIRLEEIAGELRTSEHLEEKIERDSAVKDEILAAQRKHFAAENRLVATMRDFGPEIVLSSAFSSLKSEVKRAEDEGRLPTKFDPKSLEWLLDSGQCVCGCDLDKNSQHRLAIKNLIDGYAQSSEVGILLQTASHEIQVLESKFKGAADVAMLANRDMFEATKSLQKLNQESAELNDELANHDKQNISKLGKEKRELDAENFELLRDELALTSQSESLIKAISKLQADFEKAQKTDTKSIQDKKLLGLCTLVMSGAELVRNNAIKQVRQALEDALNEYIKNLKQGNYKVHVTEDFEIKVAAGVDDLSEGEKMLLAYAFAMALRRVIGMQFPLVVDTPFGRLDTPNRTWLSESLVALVEEPDPAGIQKQVIFFMHDAEYTPSTHGVFSKSDPFLSYLVHDPESETTQFALGIDPEWKKYGSWASRGGSDN